MLQGYFRVDCPCGSGDSYAGLSPPPSLPAEAICPNDIVGDGLRQGFSGRENARNMEQGRFAARVATRRHMHQLRYRGRTCWAGETNLREANEDQRDVAKADRVRDIEPRGCAGVGQGQHQSLFQHWGGVQLRTQQRVPAGQREDIPQLRRFRYEQVEQIFEPLKEEGQVQEGNASRWGLVIILMNFSRIMNFWSF